MSFLKLLESQKIILLDGAMGTQLDKRGLMARGRNNIDAAEAVLEIHREYCQCGCDAITTNTLTMNRIFIETHNVGVDVRQVNKAGAELARQAAGKNQYVLGDISSTGQLLEPYGTYKESQFYDTFKEQAEVLAEFGVDGFIIETMFDLKEALYQIQLIRAEHALLSFPRKRESRTLIAEPGILLSALIYWNHYYAPFARARIIFRFP